MNRFALLLAGAGPLAWACQPMHAHAVTIDDMKDFPGLHGRYAPAGDCGRLPRITVDAGGMTFQFAGRSERPTRMEYAASYGGNFYEGKSLWFFPFGTEGNWPVLATFNANEKEGALTIEGQDAGYPGGPAFSARDKALVAGSPYQRCK